MIRRAFAALTLAVLLAAPTLADEKADLKAMEGTWLPTSAELGGQKFPDEQRKAIKLEIADGKFTATVNGVVDKGTFKLDTKAKPKAMDITGNDGPNKDKTYPAIYELSGDTLKVCYALEGKDRPTKLETKSGTLTFLVIYERAKK